MPDSGDCFSEGNLMEPRFLGFRAYGTFQWPPIPGAAPVGTARTGAVEIHYVRYATQPDLYAACVVWVPGTATAPFTDPLDALENLYQLSIEDLHARFIQADTPIALRFGGQGTHQVQGVRLEFLGVTVLDQFAASPSTRDRPPPLTLRLPVLATYQREGKVKRSRVRIGQPDDASVRFDLAVPLVTPLDADQAVHQTAFCEFSLIFAAGQPAPGHDEQTDGLAFDTCTFAGSKIRTPSEANAAKSSILGQFDFSQRAGSSGWIPPKHWPSKRQLLRSSLPLLGFSTAKMSPMLFEEADEESKSDGLRRFPSVAIYATTGGAIPGFVIRQRAALKAIQQGRAAGDLRVGADQGQGLQVEIRARDELGWIAYESGMHICSTIEGVITDVWNAESTDFRVSCSVGGRQALSGLKDTSAFVAEPTKSFTLPRLLGASLGGMRLAHVDLQHLQPPQPHSSLFSLGLEKDADRALFALFSPVVSKQWKELEQWAQLGSDGPPFNRTQYRASMQSEDVTLDGTSPLIAARCRARWPLLVLEHRQSTKAHVPVILAHAASHKEDEEDQYWFSVELRSPENRVGTRSPHQLALGGFFFEHLGEDGVSLVDATSGARASRLRLNPRAPLTLPNGEQVSTADVFSELNLRVDRVMPVALDAPRFGYDRTSPPVMLHSDPAAKGRYTLSLKERIAPDTERWLTAELLEQVESANSRGSTVVLSTEPFAFFRAHYRPLEARGGQDTVVVAVYDSRTWEWQTKQLDTVYHYTLPPQSIGESMDKPGRLELHDAPGQPPEDDFLPPMDPGETAVSIPKRRSVDFRLTPPTDLWVRPADVERQFVLPEWAAARLYRQRAELGLGVALEALRTEFLYGLPMSVQPALEQGPARRARVAEIEALLGRPVSVPGEGDTPWRRIVNAYARRLERLEVWADEPASSVLFAPARFRQSARFALRTTALHRAPIAELDAPAESPTQLIPGLSPRLHPAGLRGGALWPFESRNILAMLLEAPASDGGTVEGIALGVLGGDADQMAAFCNRRVRIISETRGGFVQRQQVEVIGRIAVWWHRAKHVIVYERTVNPSAQFTPEEALKTRSRRPVLRKVREYIELLQPERRYPDAPGAAPLHGSFLRALRFNQKQIAVDSLWAEDVDEIVGGSPRPVGWAVPLWNRHAALLRPQVYGRPDIAFVCAAEGEEATESAQECLNPENLYFFADTTDGATDDTDAWAPRARIDYPNLPVPRYKWPVPAYHPEDAASDRPAPNAEATPPGHYRYTWRLAPPSLRTPVNAHRGDKPLYAALETLTFSRAGRAPAAAELPEFRTLETALAMSGASLAACPVKGDWGSSGHADLDQARHVIAAVRFPRDAPQDADERERLKAAMGAVKQAMDALRNPAGALRQQVHAYQDKCRQLKGDLGPVPSECAQLGRRLSAAMDAKRLALGQQLQVWDAEFAAELERQLMVPTAQGFWNSKEDLKKELRRRLLAELRPALAATTLELGSARRGIVAVRTAIADTRTSLQQALKKAHADLEQLRKSIDHDAPWSQQRRSDFQARLAVLFQRAAGLAESAVEDAQRRMAAETDSFSEQVGVHAARALAHVAARENALQAGLHELQQDVQVMLRTLQSQLSNGDTQVGKAIGALQTHHDDPATPDDQKTVCQTLLTRLAAIRQQLSTATQQFNRVEQDWTRYTATIGEGIGQASTDARAAMVVARDEIDGAIKALQDAAGLLPASVIAASRIELEKAHLAFSAMVEHLLVRIGRDSHWAEAVIQAAHESIDGVDGLSARAENLVNEASAVAERWVIELEADLEAVEQQLAPEALAAALVDQLTAVVVEPGVEALDASWFRSGDLAVDVAATLRAASSQLLQQALAWIQSGTALAGKLIQHVETACSAIGEGLDKFLDETADAFVSRFPEFDGTFAAWVQDADSILDNAEEYKELLKAFTTFEQDSRDVVARLAATTDQAQRYGARVVDAISRIGEGNLMSAPGNILRALAAAGSPPELPNLDFARERLAYYYGMVDGHVDTTPVEAWFGRLGDEIKAIGLSLPFDRIGHQLMAVDLSKFDIGRILRSCGGMKFDRLFKGCRLPRGAADAIHVSHDFDKKNYRAWLQIEVDAPLEGRNSLFSCGPFSLDAVNSRARAVLRVEASKDTDEVARQARSSFETDFEMVVAGQVMVTLQQVVVRYDDSGSLKVDFDPKKIKLNPTLQFIQNTLGSIIPDEIGGLTVIKHNGLPVGLEHLFSMPPMSLMFGTSGVQNIQISNQFQLIAYPDFLIANRFSLARPDLPFFFTVFIIGGTGWLTVDVEYRPFNQGLLVVVDAGAGGSASIGFAFAGVTGSVAISVSVALTYRKLIGHAGGGLTVSMVVLIVGVVDVLRIATAYLTILLRLSYKENGDIDAYGSFRIKIRICRFVTISAGGQARYAMTGGKKQSSSQTSTSVEVSPVAYDKAKKLITGQGS
ncbi:hypothetical protein HIV01_012315 [Lysobacter arenosi]|uniref:Uncharacterized protein n=1 Tax=Lysobacter arenosi TaxID=2795387 RepID=A0ABX7R9J3_9GAMM|nr:hypothetical protein [Lysobacter arenosi]QSX74001.1 hypothetical protein HIV01_012315 [Lysobacter arenosi]